MTFGRNKRKNCSVALIRNSFLLHFLLHNGMRGLLTTSTRPVICQRDCFRRDSIEHGRQRLRKSLPRTKLKIDPGGFGDIPLVLVLTALVLVLTASLLEGALGPDGVGFVLFCSAPTEGLCLALLFRCSRRWFWC